MATAITKGNEASELFQEFTTDAAYLLFRWLEEEHDWLLSDESAAENITANGYEFDEDGRVI